MNEVTVTHYLWASDQKVNNSDPATETQLALNSVIDATARANVSIYPINPRGLEIVDQSQPVLLRRGSGMPYVHAGNSAFDIVRLERFVNSKDDGLEELAAGTGDLVFRSCHKCVKIQYPAMWFWLTIPSKVRFTVEIRKKAEVHGSKWAYPPNQKREQPSQPGSDLKECSLFGKFPSAALQASNLLTPRSVKLGIIRGNAGLHHACSLCSKPF